MTTNNNQLIARLATEKAGFKLIQTEAKHALATMSPEACFQLATQLYTSQVHQARMFAVLIFGTLAATQPAAFKALEQQVIHDPDWRVQEMLARAFDQYCRDIGYEASLQPKKLTNAAPRAKACESGRHDRTLRIIPG